MHFPATIVLMSLHEFFFRTLKSFALKQSNRWLHNFGVQEFGVASNDAPIYKLIAHVMLAKSSVRSRTASEPVNRMSYF